MMTEPKVKERDFSQPIEADFIVALKARNGEFCLFVESFIRRNGKSYLKHTTDIAQAKRMAKLTAMSVCDEVKDYRCTGRVERVTSDNKHRAPIEELVNR
jgi:hypothetical protein